MQFGNVFDKLAYNATQYAKHLESRAVDLRTKGNAELAANFMQAAANHRAAALEYQQRNQRTA